MFSVFRPTPGGTLSAPSSSSASASAIMKASFACPDAFSNAENSFAPQLPKSVGPYERQACLRCFGADRASRTRFG
jgi:hypothetical protein